MSEEEKEALENVKHIFGDISLEELIKNKDINVTIYSSGIIDILRVIVIVERQQREIEKLNKELQTHRNKVMSEEEIEAINYLIFHKYESSSKKEDMIDKVIEIIDRQQKEICRLQKKNNRRIKNE